MKKHFLNLLVQGRQIENKQRIRITVVLLLVFGSLFWKELSNHGIHNVYYYCNALAWLLVSVYFYIDKKIYISKIMVLFALNNFLDEIFFDPTVLGYNEIFFGILSITILYYAGKVHNK